MSVWLQILLGIAGLALSLFFNYLQVRKENEKILTTAPDDPVGTADFDNRERLSKSTNTYNES